jgi:glutathione S-transferase
MKLFSGPISMYGAKVEIALHEKRIPFDLELVAFDMVRRYEPKHPEVLRVNPYKKQVPVLIDGDVELYDSTQIFEYLESIEPSNPLWPQNVVARAQARKLEMQSDEVLFAHVIERMKPRLNEADHMRAHESKAAIFAYFEEMNALLATRDYLAGTFSFADITFFMAQLFSERLRAPIPHHLAHLNAWTKRINSREAFEPVVQRIDFFWDSKA